ncbi:TRAP transporter small permease [Acetomicrobium sp. S15 = DSM 107314]|uniref:TRAP transporter small permease n=1 Tax=Acetomicrobium sp. S15 = DSM 107314 TaxID=2529858 RepID=UPI00406C36ED
MLAIVTIQVATRLLSRSVPWSEELTRNSFIVTVFLGMTVGFRRLEHARITFLLKLLPKHLQSLYIHFYFISGTIFFVILAHQGLRMTLQQFRSGEMSPACGIPMYLVTLPISIGAALAIIAQFQSVYVDKSTRKKLIQELFVGEEGLTSEDRFQ